MSFALEHVRGLSTVHGVGSCKEKGVCSTLLRVGFVPASSVQESAFSPGVSDVSNSSFRAWATGCDATSARWGRMQASSFSLSQAPLPKNLKQRSRELVRSCSCAAANRLRPFRSFVYGLGHSRQVADRRVLRAEGCL